MAKENEQETINKQFDVFTQSLCRIYLENEEQEKGFSNLLAKFIINDYQGLLNKYELTYEELREIYPPACLRLDILKLYKGMTTRNIVRQAIVDEILKAKKK